MEYETIRPLGNWFLSFHRYIHDDDHDDDMGGHHRSCYYYHACIIILHIMYSPLWNMKSSAHRYIHGLCVCVFSPGIDKKNGAVFERFKCLACQGFALVPCPGCGSGGLTPEQRGER